MTSKLTGWVHTMIDGVLVSAGPGEPVPDWVTNSNIIEDDETGDTIPDESSTGDDDNTPADDLSAASGAELKAIATELGIATSGSKADLRERIEAKRAETSEPGGDDSDPDEDEGSGDKSRGDLETIARERGIEFDDETTDVELAALIEGE